MTSPASKSRPSGAPQRSRVVLTADGRVIVTDHWHKWAQAGHGEGSQAEPVLSRSSNQFSANLPIGLIDFGILHGEEPAVSGTTGTGALYIHGCPLRCKTCYQPEFFSKQAKIYTDSESLASLMLEYQRSGAHSISIVIGTYQPQVHRSIKLARASGLTVPIVYNYSGMLDSRMLQSLLPDIDIFMPDCKAVSKELSTVHGLPDNYQVIMKDGVRFLLTTGKQVIVRHLIVPTFPTYLEEIRQVIELFGKSDGPLTFSFLTHFYDGQTRRFHHVSQADLDKIGDLARQLGVAVYYEATSQKEVV